MRTLRLEIREGPVEGDVGPRFWLVLLAKTPRSTHTDIARIGVERASDLDTFIQCQEAVVNGVLPEFLDAERSIARAISEFYGACEPDTDEVNLDRLFEYRQAHGLRLAFRGQPLPDVYIGLRQGVHEISCHDESVFCLPVELSRVFEDARRLRLLVDEAGSATAASVKS
jgi:hypothetical protein